MADEDVKIVIKQKGTIPVYTKTKVGVSEVYHDETLKGSGTTSAPLGISDEVMEEIENAGKIDDVRVDGVSVVTDKIAEIDLTGKVDKTSEADKVYGTDAQGNQTTYSMDSFGSIDNIEIHGVAQENVNKTVDLSVIEQMVELPIPSSTYDGRVVQYIGETTATLTHNCFYECTSRIEYTDATRIVKSSSEQLVASANIETFLQSGLSLNTPYLYEKHGAYWDCIDPAGVTISGPRAGLVVGGVVNQNDQVILEVDSEQINEWAKATVQSDAGVEDVLVNGTSVVTNNVANVTVPTKVSDLTNDSNFQTATDVSTAISTHNADVNAHQDIRDLIDSLDEWTPTQYTATTTNFVVGNPYTVEEAFQRTASLFEGHQGEIDDIEALIPAQATAQNQLADKAFVNSTVATNAANFRGNWSTWNNVPTQASSYPEDYVGGRTPTNNDYMVVTDASDYASSEFIPMVAVKTKSTSSLSAVMTVTNINTGTTEDISHTTVFGTEKQLFDFDLYIIYSGPQWRIYSKLKPFVINGITYNVGSYYEWEYTDNVNFNVLLTASDLEGTWRFIYVGDWNTIGKEGWKPTYQIGTPFTQEQQAAIDSGITKNMVDNYVNPTSTAATAYNARITAVETDKRDIINSANKVYATDSIGANKNDLVYDKTATADTIAQRGTNGVLKVGTPVDNADATTKQYVDAVSGDLDDHIDDKNNPHEVTKAQVGLGNVDNTSDLNKPISTATQTALNSKQGVISDLSTIRSGAALGATAVQPGGNISDLTNDSGFITSASVAALTDVTLTDLADGQVLVYDSANSKWVNDDHIADAKALRNKDNVGSGTFVDSRAGTTTYPTPGTNLTSSTIIGDKAYINNNNNISGITVVGANAYAGSSNVTVVGNNSYALAGFSLVYGYGAAANSSASYSVVLGSFASSSNTYNTIVGASASANASAANNVIVGAYSFAGTGANYSTICGRSSSVGSYCNYSAVLGANASVIQNYSVQLGQGTNTNYGSLQFRSWPLVNGDGKIYEERLPSVVRFTTDEPTVLDWQDDEGLRKLVFMYTGEDNDLFKHGLCYQAKAKQGHPKFWCGYTSADYIPRDECVRVNNEKLFLKLAEISKARYEDEGNWENSLIGGDNAEQCFYFYYNVNDAQWRIATSNDSFEKGFRGTPDDYYFEQGETLEDFGIYVKDLTLPTEAGYDEEMFDIYYYAPVYCDGYGFGSDIQSVDYMKMMHGMNDSDWGFGWVIDNMEVWEYEVDGTTYTMPVIPETYISAQDGEEYDGVTVRWEWDDSGDGIWKYYINGEDTGYEYTTAQLEQEYGIVLDSTEAETEYIEFSFRGAKQLYWEQFNPIDDTEFAKQEDLDAFETQVQPLLDWKVNTVTSAHPDLNNYTTPGWYFFKGAPSATNKPSTLGNVFMMLVLAADDGDYLSQYIFATQINLIIGSRGWGTYAPMIFHRQRLFNTWYTWRTQLSDGASAPYIPGFDNTKKQVLVHNATSPEFRWENAE